MKVVNLTGFTVSAYCCILLDFFNLEKQIYSQWDKTYVLTTATCFCFLTSYHHAVQKEKDSIHNMHRVKIKFFFIKKQTLIVSFT